METTTDPSFEDWLSHLVASATGSRVALLLVRTLAQQPGRASYASAAELAELAGVNTPGVTRSAQLLGFSGWPALREEVRARYLASISMLEIATQHAGAGPGNPARRSLTADQRALSTSAARIRDSELTAVATLIAGSSSRVATATGSYAAVAGILAANSTLAGYPFATYPEGASTTNGIARLGPGDLLFVVSFWRISVSTLGAAAYARSRGATVCALTDHAPSAITEVADRVLIATAEGGAHFPTIVPAIAVVNAVCAELAALDPDRTRASIQEAEAAWNGTSSFVGPRG